MAPRSCVRDHLRPEVLTEFPVVWCSSCNYGRVAGDLTPNQVAEFYAANYYTHTTPDTSEHSSKRFLDRLRVHLAWRRDGGLDLSADEVPRSKPHPSFCDVGCGSGQALLRFKQAGYETFGIEPDAAARSLAGKICEVFQGTAEALPEEVGGRQFDVVLLSHVLEHCIDPIAALQNVNRLLTPGGTTIIEVPNNAALGAEIFGPGWFFADIPRHLQFFTERSLEDALARAGLRVSRTIYAGYARQFSPEWLAAQERIRVRIGVSRNGSRDAIAQGVNIWWMLAQTAFAPASRKYDSVRVHATHANAANCAAIGPQCAPI